MTCHTYANEYWKKIRNESHFDIKMALISENGHATDLHLACRSK